MSAPKGKRGPRQYRGSLALPDSLRAELIERGDISAKGKRGTVRDRSERRKAERKATKERRAAHHSAPRPAAPAPEPVAGPSKPAKRSRPADPARPVDNKGKGRDTTDTPLSRLLDRTTSSKRTRGVRKPANEHERHEDAKIAWLESQLGNGKGEDEDDGLGDLLADLDGLEERLYDTSAGHDARYRNGADLAPHSSASEEETGDEEEDAAVTDIEDADEAMWDGIAADDPIEPPSKRQRTDHGPAMPAAAPSTSLYVPPHLRKAAEPVNKPTAPVAGPSQPPADARLRRILLGHLNRLSAANMEVMLPEFEALYRSHPRAIVSSTLTELLAVDLLGARDEAGPAFLVCYAALIAALARTIGKEVAAGVVARSVEALDEYRKADRDDDGKRSLNLVSFLSQLYASQVIACPLIYDLIRELIADGLEEADIELLLRIIKLSGSQLRQDDPTALKQIIQSVEAAAGSADAPKLGSRGRFLVETLVHLRNNRQKTETGPAVDAMVNLRKFLAAMSKKRSALAPEPLRISLVDLRTASTKGKWWLVGAAWSGDTLAELELASLQIGASAAPSKSSDQTADEVVLALARKHGMNTEVRRSIFVAVMGAEDYVDACDRLAALGLKETQQREAVRVLLLCIGNERAYNPFYTLVMGRLLSPANVNSRSYQITLQYALWDLLRDLGETDVGGLERMADDDHSKVSSSNDVSDRRAGHLARAYGWWIAKGHLGLHVFKPVPFKTLKPRSTSFCHQLFAAALLGTQTSSPLLTAPPRDLRRDQAALERVFLKIGQNDKLAQGIRSFLKRRFIAVAAADDDFFGWAAKVAADTLKIGTIIAQDVNASTER